MATWTPAALASEARPLKGTAWRLVEGQHLVSTLKLVDTLSEQALLERLLDETKPIVPPECRHLHYLLHTPFRYNAPYPKGSRFRRAGFTPGVFYASEKVETAVAETAFHRLLFFAESPRTQWPRNALQFTAFSVRYGSARGLDLTLPPFSEQRAVWTAHIEYEACQHLAEQAYATGIQIIRSESARDPAARANITLLACLAFAGSAPISRQTWRLTLGRTGVRAICETPDLRLEFPPEAFAADPRIAAIQGSR